MQSIVRLLPVAAAACLLGAPAARAEEPAPDEIHVVQKRPLHEARRLEADAYGSMGIGDPYLQRWGGGLRALYHVREGLAFGLDASGTGNWETQDLVIARRELRAQVIESRQRGALFGLVSVAPIYGKVALPGDHLLHFEIFGDAGLGAAFTETDATRGARPALAAGLGNRLFLSSNLALLARLGGEIYAEQVLIAGVPRTHAMSQWSLSLGLSFYLPGRSE